MQPLDIQVVDQAISWCDGGQDFWLCTVLSTFGSSPRAPGSWLVAQANGDHCGSLSGGCVEEDFLERLQEGEFRGRINRIRYGAADGQDNPRVSLPCGGVLDVLIEHWPASPRTREHFQALKGALTGDGPEDGITPHPGTLPGTQRRPHRRWPGCTDHLPEHQ